ncbi:asparaginase [Corynebacterium frankenforstense DSM 45800]|uniref:Asparaginase n=1 Tax=Corynebacterium frankenforstense DSM 45800 TaxID=1437875 RepID=A0A1L7CRK5_9CORY|nr:asparaginase [Corynebacterium frankenforstense DSM 45800]
MVVLTTGGTIACTHDAAGALVPTVSGPQLVASVRERVPAGVTLDVRQVAELDSSSMTLAETDAVLAAVAEALAGDAAGVVVTHGTDSMEETAVAVDAFLADARPVVLTGAMRPFDDPDPDGPANLADAVTAAADPANRSRGAFISFGGELIAARGAYKRHTEAAAGFATNAPAGAPRPAALAPAPLAGVDVRTVAAYPGAPRVLIDAAVADGARGVVVEGMGAGNVGTDLAAGITDAVGRGVAVVLTTRVPAGPVAGVYGGAGGAATLFAAGVLSSGFFRAGQARILLAVALATGTDPAVLLAP